MLPGQNEATLEAYDATELRLPSGHVVRCRPLTFSEAVRFCRMFGRDAVEVSEHVRFFAEFPKRVGILDARVVDLGLEVDGLTFGEMEFCEAAALLPVLDRAVRSPDVEIAAALLEKFRARVGLEDPSPEAVIAAGERFIASLYQLVYGIARDLLLPPALKPEGMDEPAAGRKLVIGLDDMLSEYGACYGGFPAPDSSWRLFLAAVKLAGRHEARAKLAMLDAVNAAISGAFGDRSVRRIREELAAEAYPFESSGPAFQPNMFAPGYVEPAHG